MLLKSCLVYSIEVEEEAAVAGQVIVAATCLEAHDVPSGSPSREPEEVVRCLRLDQLQPLWLNKVILLPDPNWASVPRHSTKASLIQDGFVVNAFLVDKQWTARHLYEVFEEAFQAKLQSKADGDEVKR